MKYIISTFLKIGKDEHIDQLQKEGILYCNNVKYYRNLEREDILLRKDTAEGAITTSKIDWLKIFIKEKELPIKFTSARLHTFDREKDLEHIYCMYAITPDLATGKPFIDDRNVRFGEAGLLIHNPKVFLNRIQKAVRGKFKFEYKPVYYYPKDQDFNNLSVFTKHESFSYQREFRLLFQYQSTEPLILNIGSLEDISVKIEANKLSEMLLLKEKYLKNPTG
jgi:hypothetical protein